MGPSRNWLSQTSIDQTQTSISQWGEEREGSSSSPPFFSSTPPPSPAFSSFFSNRPPNTLNPPTRCKDREYGLRLCCHYAVKEKPQVKGAIIVAAPSCRFRQALGARFDFQPPCTAAGGDSPIIGQRRSGKAPKAESSPLRVDLEYVIQFYIGKPYNPILHW
ncbi:hypothetical protein JCGZ_19371 [Jatropha curcas]|uniref:Uncharacterized protein n=1 Tax=Jatropha curcas TaxID=180498 RepID=A0A067JY91_JATCU|nr:hypothetical protein JCGZ_19371 [Jatropha curcas]